MSWLDEYGELKILGLGESTHGTKEFFQAKDRIMRYMVENHGYKVFGIEADFGESIYINEAVLASDKSAIRDLMKDKMHFWTWKTEEVFDMIIWMCEYNEGKAEEEKVHYVGVDCQLNTYNPLHLYKYFEKYSKELIDEAGDVLSFLQTGTAEGYDDLDRASYDERQEQLTELLISLRAKRDELIELSSYHEYILAKRLLEVCKQTFELEYSYVNTEEIENNRDPYMAKNALWYMDEYFPASKMLMWQHNYHVGKVETYGPGGSMGHNMHLALGDSYKVIGFSFAQGGFNAIELAGGNYLGLKSLSITQNPKAQSLNFYFFETEEPAFAIKTEDMLKSDNWSNKLIDGIDMLNFGAVYNGSPTDYYYPIYQNYWDVFIHFQETRHADVLQ